MSGTQYRCIVSQTDLTTQLSAVVYSETATLTVGKAGSETRLSTRENATGGNATYETTGETQKTVAAQYKIGEKTYQKYANAYPDSDTYKLNADVYGTYVSSGSGNGEYQYFLMDGLSLNGTPDANGVFTVSFTGTAVQLRPHSLFVSAKKRTRRARCKRKRRFGRNFARACKVAVRGSA